MSEISSHKASKKITTAKNKESGITLIANNLGLACFSLAHVQIKTTKTNGVAVVRSDLQLSMNPTFVLKSNTNQQALHTEVLFKF